MSAPSLPRTKTWRRPSEFLVTAILSNHPPKDDQLPHEAEPAVVCALCHSAQSGLPISSLTSFEDLEKVAKADTGPSLLQLARVSHIHLFGISILFLLTGAIFALSETPIWFRIGVVVAPYVAIVMDIGSWWATKYYDPAFAYVVLVGGAFMDLAMACQILVSLWDMWIGPLRASLGTSRSAVKLAAKRSA